jgi:hypothetical protein
MGAALFDARSRCWGKLDGRTTFGNGVYLLNGEWLWTDPNGCHG